MTDHPMMIRSMPLAHSLFETWKQVGAWFPRRERTTKQALDLVVRNERQEHPILNLGNTGFTVHPEDLLVRGITGSLYNNGIDIRPLITPGSTRRFIPDLLPEQAEGNVDRPYWLKRPGYGGRGKVLVDEPGQVPQLRPEWDAQFHVEGQEYRAITVDHKVIQVFERHGVNGEREYNWVGVRAAPSEIKRVARKAARRLNGKNVIAWDMVLTPEDQALVFEGNTCPGVNLPTAQRIITAIYGRSYSND